MTIALLASSTDKMHLKMPNARGPRLARSLLALTLALVFLSLYNYTSPAPAVNYAPPFADKTRWNAQALDELVSSAVERTRSESQQYALQPHAEPSGFAYVFYATDDDYACSILVNIHQLRHVVRTKYSIHVLASPLITSQSISAMKNASAIVHVQDVPAMPRESSMYYNQCMLKMLSFKLHLLDPTLKRILVLDSDQLILKNLDALFTGIPSVDLAAPRAYWIAKDWISSTFMLINLSDRLWESINASLAVLPDDFYDMDLINAKFGDTVTMLSGEYITLNSHWEDWNIPSWYNPPLPPHEVYPDEEDTESHIQVAVEALANKLHQSTALATVSSTTAAESPTATAKTGDEGSSGNITVSGIDDKHINDEVMADVVGAQLPQRPQRKGHNRLPEISIEEAQRREEIREELYRLYDFASVLHFSAVGKPWSYTTQFVDQKAPYAHPLLSEQFAQWHNVADEVCPVIDRDSMIDEWFWSFSSSSTSMSSTTISSAGGSAATTATTTHTANGHYFSSSSTSSVSSLTSEPTPASSSDSSSSQPTTMATETTAASSSSTAILTTPSPTLPTTRARKGRPKAEETTKAVKNGQVKAGR